MTNREQPHREGFAIIPRHVLLNKDLTYSDKIVYGRLFSLMANERGYCWATNGSIAKSTGVATRTVSRSVSRLQELELIKVTGDDNQARRIHPADPGGQNGEPPVRQSGAPVRQSGAAISSRGNKRTTEDIRRDAATKTSLAEQIIEYHDSLRKQINPNSRPTSGRARAQVISAIAQLVTEGWDEEGLRAAARGHLADGSWWRKNGKTHPRYAYRDGAIAAELAEQGQEEAEPTKEEGGPGDDWFDDDDWEDYDGTWEGLEE